MSLFGTLVNIIQVLLSIYWYILIATAVISWIPDLAETQLGQLLHRISEPYLQVFRRFIRPLQVGGVMLDISYIVALAVYYFIELGVSAVLNLIVRSIGA